MCPKSISGVKFALGGPPSGLNMVFHTVSGWDLLIIVTTALTCQDIIHVILYPESYTAGVK